MAEINISDFEELEYNLTELGLPGFTLSIEETVKYISGPGVYIEINPNTVFEPTPDGYILKDEDSPIQISHEAYDVIKDLI